MQYSWDWGILWANTGTGDETYLYWVLIGIVWLLAIAGAAWLVAVVLGTGLGILRSYPNKLCQVIASSYVNFFRNIPLLVQLFFWYYIFPHLLPANLEHWWLKQITPETSAYLSATIGLGLFTAARVCEQVRTGIQALPIGQTYAAYATGFTVWQSYRYVLLPQALRIILPPMSSEVTNCFKNASVASLVGAAELISQIKTASEYSQQTFEFLTYATGIYLIINLLLIQAFLWLERKFALPGLIAGGK